MMKDGLVDAFYGYPMGITAENIAERFEISRSRTEFAPRRARRGTAAIESGAFDKEIMPIGTRPGAARPRPSRATAPRARHDEGDWRACAQRSSATAARSGWQRLRHQRWRGGCGHQR
ncbi:MAG: hypothetical protein U0841_29645 [Chloroflexia bacterium]